MRYSEPRAPVGGSVSVGTMRPLAREALALAGGLADTGANTRDRARPKPRGLKRHGPDLAAPEPELAKAGRLASWSEAGLYFEHFVIVGLMLLSTLGALKLLLV